MKEIRKLGFIVTLILMFSSCEELPDPAGLRGVAVVPAITNVDPGIFDSNDLANTFVQFVITTPEGTHPDKISVLGSYQDNYERVVLAEVTSFPSTVKIKASEIAQKIGLSLNAIVNGDIFTFELLTKANNLSTYSTAALIVPVACAYDVNRATGSYHSVSADWNSEGNITLSADPVNKYKIYVTGLEEIEGLVEDLGPLVMYINPATYAVTVPEKAIASDGWGYGSVSYSGTGVYSSCDGSYVMYFEISLSDLGSQGTYTFTLTRNP